MTEAIRYHSGYEAGKMGKEAILENICSFHKMVEEMGLTHAELMSKLKSRLGDLTEGKLQEMKGIAEGAGVDVQDVQMLNLFAQEWMPEGCTVFFAAGKASASGTTVFAKNSDKGGNMQFTGKNHHNFHEINVVSFFENDDGSHVIGVSAAGSTGIKMGLNSHGVAAATNYGYSAAAKIRPLSMEDQFAGDRAQVARDALQCKTALEAAQYTAARLIAHPMATSGMLEFADASEVYIVENVYEYVAVKKVTDAVDSRSNYLQILEALNEPGNASCYCRYHRTQELLHKLEGHVTAEDLKKISMDHHDGTGSVGICRHTEGIRSSTQASAVMELNKEHPEQSVIHIALGKPCNAWRNADGNVTIRMDMKKEEIPAEFLRGDAYVKYGDAAPLEI